MGKMLNISNINAKDIFFNYWKVFLALHAASVHAAHDQEWSLNPKGIMYV